MWVDYFLYIVLILMLLISFLLPSGGFTGMLVYASRRLCRRSGGGIVVVLLSGGALLLLTPLMVWAGLFLNQLLMYVCLDQEPLKQFPQQYAWLLDMHEMFGYAQFLWEFLGWFFIAEGITSGWMVYKGIGLRMRAGDRGGRLGLLLILLAWLIVGGGLMTLFFTTMGG
jgi:hypothetical protein